MTQPTFVPITEADQVRPARHLHVPGAWTTDRPAELNVPSALRGPSVGTPGPDAGFAMRLARRFEHDLKLTEGETEHDVLLGCALIAARRAALYGRAPSIYDLQVALAVWGFLVDAPADVTAVRRQAFASVSHDYVSQRALVDALPESTLRLTPADAQAQFARGDGLALVTMPVAAA
ncbi:MAG TPA: hypothetical protein VHV57_10685 [Acidimicrobiales bacterium]|jgi:hypothetical protein|nr:hypothetical protein [Acidimicrobiales bacterium]